MSRLPSLKFRDVKRILESLGFKLVRISGSHHIFCNRETGKTIPVPFQRRNLSKGTLMAIIHQSGLTREEFLDLM